ncbi:21033_t:CDS:2 [Entrophospora sp. SA101]|nr:21033_t:CDS:2 [Entrophospora sp. SA101]
MVTCLDIMSEKLIYGTNDCLIYFCDATSGKLIYELKGHEGPILGIQSNRRSNPIGISNGCLVTSVDGYKNLHVWDISNGNLKYLLGTHSGTISYFQHDEWKIISGTDFVVDDDDYFDGTGNFGSSEGVVCLWSMETGNHIHDLLTGISTLW